MMAWDVVVMLSGSFMRPVGVAIVVSSAVGYWVISTWLDGFAYRMDISPFIFIGAAVAMLAIAGLTVSSQSFKAAMANPAVSIGSE